MKRAIQYIILVIVILAIPFSIGYFVADTAMEATSEKMTLVDVKAICDKAHDEISRQSEIDCANAQEITNTTYNCDGYGKNAICSVKKN